MYFNAKKTVIDTQALTIIEYASIKCNCYEKNRKKEKRKVGKRNYKKNFRESYTAKRKKKESIRSRTKERAMEFLKSPMFMKHT